MRAHSTAHLSWPLDTEAWSRRAADHHGQQASRQLLQTNFAAAESDGASECQNVFCARPNSADSSPFRAEDKCFGSCKDGSDACCCECTLGKAPFWCIVFILPFVVLVSILVAICLWRRHRAKHRVLQCAEGQSAAELQQASVKYMREAHMQQRAQQKAAEAEAAQMGPAHTMSYAQEPVAPAAKAPKRPPSRTKTPHGMTSRHNNELYTTAPQDTSSTRSSATFGFEHRR